MTKATKSSEPPPLTRCLALIGGRGCGKSSVSRRILRVRSNFMLFSLDDLMRYESGGKSIPQVVEEIGWHGFREREYEVVRKVSAFRGSALFDCGGGIVVDLDEEGNEVYSERKISTLSRNASILYIHRETKYLAKRIADDPNRPSLSTSESFEQIMARRDPWYRRAADGIIDATKLSKPELVEAALDWFYADLRSRGE